MTSNEKRFFAVGLLVGLAVTCAAFLLLYRSPASPTAAVADTSVSNNASSTPAESETALELSSDDQARIGVRTITVRRETLHGEVMAPGWVEEMDTAVHAINSPFAGRIDRLLVNQPGETIRKGQAIALIDGPDVTATVNEHKTALQNQRQFTAEHRTELMARADALVKSTSSKLAALGFTAAQIQDIEHIPEKEIRARVVSDSDGVLRTKNVVEGRSIGTGETVVSLTDLNRVWVKASVFESDVSQIHPGILVQITGEALGGMTLQGTMKVMEPRADSQTRTVPVRIEVQNPGMRLRPGMFVRADFRVPMGTNVLIVPRSAVIDTGTSTFVYVKYGDMFQRRMVRLGRATKNAYPVFQGLNDGDTVVTEGAFLIDSQARLTSDLDEAQSAGAGENHYRLTFQISPDPLKAQKDLSVRVSVLDERNQPVKDADVRVVVRMPAMPSMGMPEMQNRIDLHSRDAEYVGHINFGMPGQWRLSIEAHKGSELLAAYGTGLTVR